MPIEQSQSGRRVILASNRGPVEYSLDKNGAVRTKRGAGGMVTALQPAINYAPPGGFTWVAIAMTEGDRLVAQRQAEANKAKSDDAEQPIGATNGATPSSGLDSKTHRKSHTRPLLDASRYVSVPPAIYKRFYDRISNQVLWFLQHYLWNQIEEPTFTAQNYEEWEQGYVQVNQAIANAVCEEVLRKPGPALVMFQDYHLYLAPEMVRQGLKREGRLEETILQHFIHIPWPSLRYWQLLPRTWLLAIYESVLANDILGFQTNLDMMNFLSSTQVLLGDAQITYDKRGGRIVWRNHTTYARAYPISIDVDEVRQNAARGERLHANELRPLLGAQTIMRVDRLEPTKNIVRGFEAFELLLSRRHDLIGKVKFLAFLIPSRESIKIYRHYGRRVHQIIDKINETYGHDGWQPIEAFFENNRARALAAMRHYDVLLINPLIDGMNLVAKEGPIVNQQDGVLILSETAGASQQLHESALTIIPTDVEETARELINALEMPAEERRKRSDLARANIERENLEAWLRQQFMDVEEISRRPSTPQVTVPEKRS
ncbi:MAG TPA: trehalose-6-phosphate synthase [Ktedonobacterales bacterium]